MKNRLKTYTSQRQYYWFGAIIGLVSLGMMLRIWGTDFGLPFIYHVDEPTYISAAVNLGAGRIARQLNPPVFPNLLFLEYGVYYVVERLSGHLSSAAEFEGIYRTDPSIFFLLGRLTTAIVGSLNILVVYFIGKRSSNRLVGILAALLLSVSFLHVRDSHFAVPDVLMTLLVSMSVLCSLFSIDEKGAKFLYLAAFTGGIAIASKWSAWPVIFPLGYVFIARERRNAERPWVRRVISHGTIPLVCLLAGFFLGGFQLLLKPGSYLAYALNEVQSGSAGGFGIWQIDTVPGYIFYLKVLWIGLGGILLIMGIMGIIFHIRTAALGHKPESVVLLLFPLVYFVVMGATHHYFARYALPSVPFIVLFAGEFMVAIAAQAESRWNKTGWIILSILVLATAAQPLINSLRFDFLMTQLDTRTIAKKWIEENIPAGSTVAMDWPIHTPQLSSAQFDITIEGELGLANHPMDYYKQEGFDYLIASSYIYEIPLVIEPMNQEREEFYETIGNETELLREFYPGDDFMNAPFAFDEIYGPFVSLWQRERPGPILKIYHLGD